MNSHEKDLTTGAAIMPMFVSNNSKLLESTYTFDRRSNIMKQQRSSEALNSEPRSFLRKRGFLDILVVFRLDLGQISFNLVKNALASRQLGFLATSIAICDIDSGMRRNQNFGTFF